MSVSLPYVKGVRHFPINLSRAWLLFWCLVPTGTYVLSMICIVTGISSLQLETQGMLTESNSLLFILRASWLREVWYCIQDMCWLFRVSVVGP